MAKVRKLKWNLRAAKAKISMRGNHVLGFVSVEFKDIAFLNTMSSLNQTKCFMMMAFYGSTRYP